MRHTANIRLFAKDRSLAITLNGDSDGICVSFAVTRLCGFVIGREYLCTNARKGNLLPVGNEETVPGEGAVGAVPFRGSWDVGMWR